ncbi:hypothetical protein QBB33_26130 [Streptomyces scabiei]|uniref:VMAP-C domain-containing protein n=1 Tax=Streptomyces scabiei TaxID=1930 RepID=UPI001B300B74|nr:MULTISPECIES: hypothetical protein [Streptomyces]MBP5872207.1 hypothetical protein [Streptomyces sp. LBUM 1485]MBP5918549.1 hypothetical protein [Streptomyces sp. LBUM 1486]MDX3026567.1 hypothetical protein [Streptomyces scabiei]MDX3205603.1 hypothetical protein [Streptomyces scabiei]MDX3275377.1 hypothetical protein [Streptomyces scabiei]
MRDHTDVRADGPEPGQAANRARLRVASDVVDVLLSDPVLFDAGLARFDELSRHLGQHPAVDARQPATGARNHVTALVRACMREPFGLAGLAGTLHLMGALPETTKTVEQLAEEWQALSFHPDTDWDALRALLSVLAPADLPRLVNRATEGRLPPGEGPAGGTAWLALVHLTTWNAPPSGLPPALAFLLLLVHSPEVRSELGQERHRQLETRARAWARHSALEDEYDRQAEECRSEFAGQSAGPLTRSVVVQVVPDTLDPDRYHLTCWAQTDPDRWSPHRLAESVATRADLEQAVVRTLTDAEERTHWQQVSGLAVEFILPLELLNSPVQRWGVPETFEPRGPVPGTPVPSRPVVVRSLDRMRARDTHRHWHTRWQRLLHSEGRVLWSSSNGRGAVERMSDALDDDPGLVACVLSRPPGSYDGDGYAEVRAALWHGLPIVVWDRLDCQRPGFRAAAEELLSGGRLAELPQRLGRLRRDGQLDRHVVVLWDDPTQQPDAGGALGTPWSSS